MTTVLEEILEIYESFDEEKRRECGRDVVTIIKQTLSNLKVDSLSVTLNALKLLELISALHSQEFLSSLDELFPILLVGVPPLPYLLYLTTLPFSLSWTTPELLSDITPSDSLALSWFDCPSPQLSNSSSRLWSADSTIQRFRSNAQL
jgi:hypothetical protein